MIIKEIQVQHILSKTSINLGDYVINPYKGCAFGCVYCYAKTTKSAKKQTSSWGDYVIVKTNAAQILEKEITLKKPKTVLIGSLTDCFQPIEKKYKITQKIIRVLQNNQIKYNILTRSPLLLDYINLIDPKYCQKIYFTLNHYEKNLKKTLEPKAPDFETQLKSINFIIQNTGINIIPYICPILPHNFNPAQILKNFHQLKTIEFEALNFFSAPKELTHYLLNSNKETNEFYKKLFTDLVFYENIWLNINNKINEVSHDYNVKVFFHQHQFNDYFKNKYI